MISQELLTELTKAGFPFSTETGLSELIEACGEEFACLSIARSIPEEPATKWQAQGWSHQFDAVIGDCPIPECCPDATVGSTPEEAVARLYVALFAPERKDATH